MPVREELLRQILDLPKKQRLRIAHLLLASISQPEERTEKEWVVEIERRARAAESDPGRAFDEVVAEIESELLGSRSQSGS